MIRDDTRSGALTRLSIVAIVGLLVGLLVVSMSAVRRANLKARDLQTRVDYLMGILDDGDVRLAQLVTDKQKVEGQRDKLQAYLDGLEQLPTKVRVVYRPCRVTPVFPRDAQFVGTSRRER